MAPQLFQQRVPKLILVLPLLFLAIGCGVSTPTEAQWVTSQGGRLEGDAHARAERVATPLLRKTGSPCLRIVVLKSQDVCAYAWRAGSIYVTRGLVERLDDAELAAAIAHEIGHLLDDGHLRPVEALSGPMPPHPPQVDAEQRADAIGVMLLESAGIETSAMTRMLAKVRASAAPMSRVSASLADRIELLQDLP